jgi:hypothetical protein
LESLEEFSAERKIAKREGKINNSVCKIQPNPLFFNLHPNSEGMSSFNFLNLPEELRNEIYRHVLVSPTDLVIFNTTPNLAFCCCDTLFVHNEGPTFYGGNESRVFTNQLPKGLRKCNTKELPARAPCSLNLPKSTVKTFGNFFQWHPNIALLRTCKQIYQEALRIVYGENRFCFDERFLLVLDKDFSDTNLLSGPAFISATAICFDFRTCTLEIHKLVTS